MDDSIPFSLNDKYDLRTFTGRLRHFLNITDPRTLMYQSIYLIYITNNIYLILYQSNI
jgi:hypothetical protein